MAIYNTYFSVLGLQDSLGVLPNLGVLPGLGRLDDLGEYAFSPASLFLNGEQGVWYDPSDLTPEKVSWRRNLLTYSQDFENAAWTKSNASLLSNLALYSQDFDNAYWTKFRGTLTANNATAPDGTTTADTWTEDTASGTHEINASVLTLAANVTMTYQVRVKRSSGSRNFRITSYAGVDGLRAVFNLDTLVATNASYGTSTFVSASVVSIGSGWFLCTLTGSIATANPIVAFELVSGTSTVIYTGDGTSGLQFWGAQFVPGSTAQTYTRSLATAAPIQFADPLGGTLADKLVENTALNIHYQIQSLTALSPASKTYAVSAYLKDADGRFATLGISDVSTGTRFAVANFNLTNGTVAASAAEGTGYAVVSSSIENAGSGWYRCIVVCTAGTTVTSLGAVVGLSNQSAIPTGAGGFVSYTGNGTSGFFIYGAQVEQASTASAYQRITDFSSDFLAAFPTHALYQESDGAAPVTLLGQSVGYVVDKRLGGLSALGSELVTNGNFATATNWTLGSGWFISGGVAFRVTDSTFTNLTQDNILQIGRTYKIEFDLLSVNGTVKVFAGGGNGSNTFSTVGRKQAILTCVGTTNLVVQATTAATTATIDNISVREVPGNHALQATSASRPTLQARSNLLTYTEQFDNAAWNKSRSTITANSTVAPDGTTTADKLIATSVSGTHRIFSAGITNSRTTIYTLSAYFKASEYTYAGLMVSDSTEADQNRVQWNLTDGTSINAPVGSTILLLSTSFTDVGNGWKRCAMTVSADATEPSINAWLFIIDNSNAASFTGNDVNGVFAWGAQIELGSTATTYQRVTTATDYADVGLPRNLTFDGVDDSLATAGNVDFATWTVGTRRNLLTVPTMFDDAYWTKQSTTVAANNATAPDGTQTADTLAGIATFTSYINSAPVTATASTTYTASVYIKAGTAASTRFRVYDGPLSNSIASAIVNWSVGVPSLGFVTGWSSTPTLTDVGNGWYRIVGTFSTGIYTTLSFLYYPDNASVGANSLLWGAQLELGSTATAFQDVGTDKVTLFSGVFKQSDAARGVFAHLGNRSDRTFRTEAPPASLSGFGWYSSGSAAVSGITVNAPNAPTTQVYTGLADIAAPLRTLRLNGAQVAADSLSQGTGTFASDIFYVGRRGDNLLFFNGRLFQLVIRGAATDSVTVGNAERWVGQLTGVAL